MRNTKFEWKHALIPHSLIVFRLFKTNSNRHRLIDMAGTRRNDVQRQYTIRLRVKFSKTAVRQTMLYELDVGLALNQIVVIKLQVMELRMLHLMVEVTRLDRIRNNHIRVSLTIWEIEHILRGDDVYIARKIRQIHGTR